MDEAVVVVAVVVVVVVLALAVELVLPHRKVVAKPFLTQSVLSLLSLGLRTRIVTLAISFGLKA
jgi:hypothetical protein